MHRFIILVSAFLTGAILVGESASARTRCRQSFESNLKSMIRMANTLSDPCFKEVDNPKSNSNRIRQVCSDKEYQIVLQIQQGGNQLAILCHDEKECKPELEKLQVCGPRRPLQYYIDKLGLK